MGTEHDIRLSFDRVPEIYDRVRPGYPPEFFDALFTLLPENARIVEVGPGTGQATMALLRNGAHVIAVEIGPHLAAFLRRKFASNHDLHVLTGDFETVRLDVHSFDAVVCATAYHWVGPDAQVERPLELLAEDGVVAIIDLIQVAGPDGGYFDRVRPVYQRFGQERNDWTPPTHATATPQIAEHLRASDRFRTVEVQTVPWDQTYTAESYRDLLLSYSGTQMMHEPEKSAMVDELVAIVEDEFDGSIVRPLVAALTIARS